MGNLTKAEQLQKTINDKLGITKTAGTSKKRIYVSGSAICRFWGHVKKTEGCWEWNGAKSNGYGYIQNDEKLVIAAHRFSFDLNNGKIPVGLTIDHLCRNRACVNPDHLEAVTNKENILRGEGLSAKEARQTHCIHGHLLSGDNLIVTKEGWRRCKTCRDAWNRKRKW